MYQIMRQIASDPEDHTQVDLLFANVSLQDILLRNELDSLAKQHSNLRVHYVLDSAPEGWLGDIGYINADMIRAHCPGLSDSTLLLFCGPRPMTKSLESIVADMGFSKQQYHTF
jgi:cytochrome-b5 reductase